MVKTPKGAPLLMPLLCLALPSAGGCSGEGEQATFQVDVRPNLEDIDAQGQPYNPSTQSFIRGHHRLDKATKAEVVISSQGRGQITLSPPEGPALMTITGLPFDQLLPRLHYKPAPEPDPFDAFNLMMAEYSRNGLSVPKGQTGDDMAHFETSLNEELPWTLEGDYNFSPNPELRPLRVGVVNNCLNPGLWEVSAIDRAGEIYHAWFDFPQDGYAEAVARVNGLSPAFALDSVQWREDAVKLDLDRLREEVGDLGRVGFALSTDLRAGFSSQDSRRKLSKRFALVDTVGEEGEGQGLSAPANWMDLVTRPVHLSEFIPPGKYDLKKRRIFDLSFLSQPKDAQVRWVSPRTDYTPLDGQAPAPREPGYIELDLDLGARRIIVGNLPVDLLVPAEEMTLHGFGVGILSASDFAERRAYLLKEGPAPSFMYLVEEGPEGTLALNSHDLGIEQLFIRTHLEDADPWWEITITSYERIVDLVRYRVEVPRALHEPLRAASANYVSPIFYTYRDDNLR